MTKPVIPNAEFSEPWHRYFEGYDVYVDTLVERISELEAAGENEQEQPNQLAQIDSWLLEGDSRDVQVGNNVEVTVVQTSFSSQGEGASTFTGSIAGLVEGFGSAAAAFCKVYLNDKQVQDFRITLSGSITSASFSFATRETGSKSVKVTLTTSPDVTFKMLGNGRTFTTMLEKKD